jgi:hypothetical protein
MFQIEPNGRSVVGPNFSETKFSDRKRLGELEIAKLPLEHIRTLIQRERPETTLAELQDFEDNLHFITFDAGQPADVWALYILFPVDEPANHAFEVQTKAFHLKAGSYVVDNYTLPEGIDVAGTLEIQLTADFHAAFFEQLAGGRHLIVLDYELLESKSLADPNGIAFRRAQGTLVDELRHAADREFFPEIFSEDEAEKHYFDRTAEIRSIQASATFFRDHYKMDLESIRNDLFHQLSGGALSEPASTPTRKSKKLDAIILEAFESK